MKPRSLLAGMVLSAPLVAAMAADPAPVPWPYPLPPAGWVVPAPFFAYPQPVYPVPTYQPQAYTPPAQNPYLPPRPPVGQAPAPIPVIPWPFVLPPPAPAAPAAAPAATSAPAPAPTPAATGPTAAPAAAPAAAQAVAKPQLGAEAQKALAQAEADVQAARAGFTLWVPAENALVAAQEAAKAGDSEAVLKLAKTIAELTRLGAAQAKYPSTEGVSEPVVVPAPAATPVPVRPAAAATPSPPPSAAPAAVPAAAQAVAKPQLSGEAEKALAQAEADVQSARAGFTLWVPAENAFVAAQEAAKAGDSEAVLKLAKTIAELTRLGAGQAKYPSTETPPPEALVVTTLPPALTAEAEKALAQAEADVQAARAGFTLWVPAENALIAAKEAAKAGDSEAVLKLSKVVAELTRLGAEQAKYPSTETPAKAAAKKAAKPKAKQTPRASKPTTAKPASKPASKPVGKAAATTPTVTATATAAAQAPAAAAPAPASAKPAAEGGRPKPRKLCWQGDRLDVCPEK